MQKGNFYQKARQHILALIHSGQLSPGDKLPSERCLCEELSLNRNTVRHALLLMQREGRIFRLERKGWYVSPVRLIYQPANHVNFARLAAEQGMDAGWTTDDMGIIAAGEAIDACGDDGFPDLQNVYQMENTYLLNEQKVAYTLTFLHADKLRGIVPKTVERAMTQVVKDDYGISLVQRNLLIRPILLPKDVTSILGISYGAPGIYIKRIKTNGSDCVLTVELEYWRFDAIELRVDMI